MNVFPPLLKSPVVPVLVRLANPLKVQPFKKKVGLVAVTFPPKVAEGPNVRFAAPVNVIICAVAAVCVNCLNSKVPAEKPAVPMLMNWPAARLEVQAPLASNCTPVPLVEVTTMLSLKVVPDEFWPIYIPLPEVVALLKVAVLLKTFPVLLLATIRLAVPVLLKVAELLN